jgi:hypothetical protein
MGKREGGFPIAAVEMAEVLGLLRRNTAAVLDFVSSIVHCFTVPGVRFLSVWDTSQGYNGLI